MKVLVVNAGSSSLKYQLFDTESGNVLAKGLCERIGIEGSKLTHKAQGKEEYTKETPLPDHSEATKLVVEALLDKTYGCISSVDEIEAIGHRVVHGGPYFTKSTLVTPEVVAVLEKCVSFAPLHTPAHIMGIKGCTAVMPTKPQILVFDTAFHQTMPEEAYFYAVPYEYYDKYKIRKYGFHGTSHRFVSGELARAMGKNPEDLKIVSCHLGNGSSITAVDAGKSVDTTMGFTPLDGVVMGTRSGAVDPSAVTYVAKKLGLTPDEMSDYLNKKSGLLGVSGVSSDNREVQKAADEGNERAKLVSEMLCYEIKKYIGSFAAAMNGMDAVLFTGGIGENSWEVRQGVCENMEYLGIKIDEELNKNTRGKLMKISTPDSKVEVWIVPTNEELLIARDTLAIVEASK